MSETLQALFRACAERGHTITIPLTTQYEFERQQSELGQKEMSKLEHAYKLLDKYRVRHSRIEPMQVVKHPELTGLIRQNGVDVTVEEPTFEDFREAHKRACLHQSPHLPDSKSDEMRDLVIWFMALRIASQDGGALLASRDEVHTHPRGDHEALPVGLVRVRSVEEALQFFDVETPAGRLVEELLATVWIDLLEVGLPLTPEFALMGVSEATFVQGVHGPSLTTFVFKARTQDGSLLQASTRIVMVDGFITQVILSQVIIQGETWQGASLPLVITPNKAFHVEPDDYQERISALRAVLEEKS